MSVNQHVNNLSSLSNLRLVIRELRQETLWLALPGLFIISIVLVFAAKYMADTLYGGLSGLLMFLLAMLVWMLHGSDHRIRAWTLVGGLIAIILLLTLWAEMPIAVISLAIPVGFAMLFIGLRGGLLTAVACTTVLLYLPDLVYSVDFAVRVMSVLQIWGMVWVIWLTSRPLLIAMAWYSDSHGRSLAALEEARQYQFQLGETLDDLAEANLQLTRLNRLATAMRQRAENARLDKERFVANVSHELRTPLNMIIGFIEIVMNVPETYGRSIPQSLLADLAVVLRNSRHLSNLIDDVLELSQIDAGQVALVKEWVAMRDIVEAAAMAVRPLYDSKNLDLDVHIDPDLPPLFCDRTRVRQVLLNLLSNAGRFTEQGGVTVTARYEQPYVVASVADTGPGIAPENTDTIFQPFYQAGNGASRQGGSGLGLSISKNFVELHEGTMWLESNVGEGTTISFRLPLEDISTGTGTASRWVNPYTNFKERTHKVTLPSLPDRIRLIVLERGDVLQKLLVRHLNGAEVVAVPTVDEALKEALRVPAHLVLINEVSIHETLAEIESRLTLPLGLPVFICSLPGARESAGALGVIKYLVKPVQRDVLLVALESLSLTGHSILIVDDDLDAQRLFRRMLATVKGDHIYRVQRAGKWPTSPGDDAE